MRNTITPTVNRIVLLTVIAANAQPIEIPAIVTHVHSDDCISVVAFSAYSIEGLHAGGTVPLTSVLYDEDKDKRHTWRWAEYQKGQAVKNDDLVKVLASAIDDLSKRVDGLAANLAALNLAQPAKEQVKPADGQPSIALLGVGAPAPGQVDAQPSANPTP